MYDDSNSDLEILREDARRTTERLELVRHRRERFRGTLNVSMPKIADEKKRAKWFGLPPSSIVIAKRPSSAPF